MAREVPQYISQLNVGSMPKIQMSFAQAEATQQASAQLSVIAQDVQKKSTELQDLRTETTYKENLNRIYNENRSNPEGFNKSYDGFYKEFRSKLPNSEFTQKLDIQQGLFSQSYRDKVMEQYSKNVDEDHKFEQDKTLLVNNGMRAELAKDLLSDIPEVAQSAAQKTQLLDEQDDAIYSTKNWDGSNRWSDEARTKGVVNRATTMFKALPAAKRLEATGAVPADFMDVMGTIWQSEVRADNPDAVTPDGDGSVAKYGINSKHNKGVDVANLTPEGALKIYKEKYWDKYKIGELPANVRGVVMDGMVNGAPKELLERARAGASVAELIQIRQDYYDKISPGKDKAVVTSWNNRLNKYRHMILSDAKKYIDPDTIESLDKEARSEIQTEMTMWRENAPKAAMLAGARTVEDIVKPQLARNVPKQYARVIDNDAAKGMGVRVNQMQNTNDVLALVDELDAKYGDFKTNAIQDIVTHGDLKPEMNAAINIASLRSPEFKPHIDLLMKASQSEVGEEAETKGLKALFKSRGYNEDSLKSEIPDDFRDMQDAQTYEAGGNYNYASAQESILLTMAKAKMVFDGSTAAQAMKFAMAPLSAQYGIAEVNNVPIRIPVGFDTGIIADELETFIDEKLPTLAAPMNNKDFKYSTKEIIPVLNEAKDGIVFTVPRVGSLKGKDGNVLSVSLKDLQGAKKPERKPIGPYKGGIPIMRGGF